MEFLNVALHKRFVCEALLTNAALVRLLSKVYNANVYIQVMLLSELISRLA